MSREWKLEADLDGPVRRQDDRPSVAIIINTYNDQEFLADALDSALAQTTPADEIVVVDDGSTQPPDDILRRYPGVRLLRQHNQGLAAARNLGLGAINSDFVVFLDADDRLLPDAVSAGLDCFGGNPEAALVYGAHRRVDANLQQVGPDRLSILENDPFVDLLKRNLIGMHATVMYRTPVLRSVGGFDASLRACEDYDLYLRLAKTHRMAWHSGMVAEYRWHGANMSGDTGMMLKQALEVLDRHGASNPAPDLQQAWREGRRNWQNYYASVAATETPRPESSNTMKSRLSDTKMFLRRAVRAVRRRWSGRNWPPAVGKVNLGDLASTRPVSTDFGFDRGQPIDRYYIERFLADNASTVRGRVLEVGDASYSRRYGGDAVTHQDVLHIDAGSPDATIVGDLTDPNVLPNESFDCIVLTQTLHLIFDLPAAAQRLHAALRPGGTLLLTVPGITPVERGRWGAMWYWSFTAVALERLFAPVFGPANCRVATNGNVLAATAMLQGLAVCEVPTSKLRETDTAFPVVVTLRAQKAG